MYIRYETRLYHYNISSIKTIQHQEHRQLTSYFFILIPTIDRIQKTIKNLQNLSEDSSSTFREYKSKTHANI